ncbi:uncharacterized protein LOC126898382 [Daktulosphaira vitifoliae]|uniref:uncharacterized protein LOC126898382 n=1 Tax=Daktulosphaira vitifoliae TaxID=58002 RepID=UPI0021A9B8EF|nr:uncharacterized protein LOC126898382 [Daktulosphaira vitifoliae]
MLFLYIYSFTFICVINCNISINEKIKNLNSLVSNPNWLKFNNVILPTEHIDGECRKIPFSELFSKTNGAVFTNENYSIKMKRFHTMLSCSFALGLDHVAKLMHNLWNYCKQVYSEEKCSCEQFPDSSSEESEVKENCRNKLINSLDASALELMRQMLKYFTVSSDTKQEASILPVLDIMTDFAGNTFLTDFCMDQNISKISIILKKFIMGNCWFVENNPASIQKPVDNNINENNCKDDVLAKEIKKLNNYLIKFMNDSGFKKICM